MKNEKQHIAILGAGESGVGAALLAKAKGMLPFVSDKGKVKPSYQKELEDNAVRAHFVKFGGVKRCIIDREAGTG